MEGEVKNFRVSALKDFLPKYKGGAPLSWGGWGSKTGLRVQALRVTTSTEGDERKAKVLRA